MKKKNARLVILIIILIFLVVALGGFFIYHKLLSNNEQENIEDNNISNDEKDNYNDMQKCDNDYAMMYNDKYIYKIKVTNKNGAKVYEYDGSSYKETNEFINNGEEIGIVADVVDRYLFYTDNNNKVKYDSFDEIKNYYYFTIDVCDKSKYVKYTDVEIIESSIVASGKFDDTRKYYTAEDEYLYSGPGLSFEGNSEDKKINKGTILEIDTYSRIGNAVWLYVNNDNYTGWILENYYQSVNYPYNEIKYGSASLLDDTAGELDLNDDENLYKFAFSNDSIILKIPKGTKISYTYSIDIPGITYYYVNYNDNLGWIEILG